MSRVIAIANQKGGVGKTTTTFNVGAALAEWGRRVLLIDLDQQGHLTIYAGKEPDDVAVTIYDVLSDYANPKQRKPRPLASIVQQVTERLYLVPSNLELATLDLEIDRAFNREHILEQALSPIRDQFDYILFDCPPNLSLLVINALTAADEVLIPLQTDYLATRGLVRLMDSIDAVQRRLNPRLRYAGILLTLADERTRHAREVRDNTRNSAALAQKDIPVFQAIIKMSVRLKDSTTSGHSILEEEPDGEAAAAYRQVAEELDHHA